MKPTYHKTFMRLLHGDEDPKGSFRKLSAIVGPYESGISDPGCIRLDSKIFIKLRASVCKLLIPTSVVIKLRNGKVRLRLRFLIAISEGVQEVKTFRRHDSRNPPNVHNDSRQMSSESQSMNES